MRLHLSPALALSLLAASASAQLAQPGSPASLANTLPADLPAVVLAGPDVAAYLAEDEVEGPFPFRYGAILSTAVDIRSAGRWDETDTHLVWRTEIVSPGALSLGIEFDRYDLPAGGELYLYDPERRTVLGAFGEANEQENGELAIQPIRGDRVVVEYQQPLALAELPALRIGRVVHDYRGVLEHLSGVVQLRPFCEIDINCPEGAPYQDIKHSVVRVLNGGILCSAGLLNNSNEDGTPYMLTANHCGSMTNVVARFNYEYTTCGSGGTGSNQTLSGATLLAASASFDSQLYRLNQTPPQNYKPYYAGWSIATSFPTGPIVGVHHAAGSPKKLSIANQPPSVSTEFFTVAWDEGIIEGGSSGSPLFDANERVIGPACCVNNFNCNGQTTSYGRFGKFYNNRNLARWLDPSASSNGVLDGMFLYEPEAVPFNGDGSNPEVYTSTLPALGSTWTGTVDVSGQPGATTTILVGYAGKSVTNLSYGQLLLDATSPKLFQSNAPVVGTTSTHSNVLPNDPFFAGAVAFTQVAILGGGVQLTNGIKLRLN